VELEAGPSTSMSDHERTSRPPANPGEGSANGSANGGNGATVVALRPHATPPPKRPRRRVRIRKLRLFLLLFGLGILAAVSTVFGMMMAVASDLPKLELKAARNSHIVDKDGKDLGLLIGNQKRVFLKEADIAPVMKHAIIAIEDRRFYTNEGVDLRGIGRALYQDVVQKRVVQGGSTITQQLVKNALAAQDDRTLFQKLREAALAYHLTHKWSKERILNTYLNTIYFGNGAYGIEAAARTYFQPNHPGCDETGDKICADDLLPQEAALLAGMVSSPTAYDPIAHPDAARARRDLVLQRMFEQDFITQAQYEEATAAPIPEQGDLQPPAEDTRYPYFTSWIKQQVVDQLGGGQEGARKAFEGGLTIRTTIDSELQDAAEGAVNQWLPNRDGPRAALVAIENSSGKVRAMVGGNSDRYNEVPFNLATQGQRQPGSAIKPFILAEALTQGISPNSLWASKKLQIDVPHSKEVFTVNNYEGAYSGTTTLARATTFSDNSVFAQVGIKVGTRKVARLAERMGIRTNVSHNYAMTLGGLKQGVSPLDMAHAYETFAAGGDLIYGTLSPGADNARDETAPGPVGIERITRRDDGKDVAVRLPNGDEAVNHKQRRNILKHEVATQVGSLLQGVVHYGTGTRAQVPNLVVAGKTGTTEGYGDAWFVGWTPKYTVAVWVGYPNEFKSMETEFAGQPVAGGTYPASIFRTFIETDLRNNPPKPEETPTPTAPAPGATAAPTTPAPTATAAPDTGGTAPEPTPAPTEAPAPEPTTAPPETTPAPGGDQAPAPED
jgi:penicillin-binding protein 1A